MHKIHAGVLGVLLLLYCFPISALYFLLQGHPYTRPAFQFYFLMHFRPWTWSQTSFTSSDTVLELTRLVLLECILLPWIIGDEKLGESVDSIQYHSERITSAHSFLQAYRQLKPRKHDIWNCVFFCCHIKVCMSTYSNPQLYRFFHQMGCPYQAW